MNSLREVLFMAALATEGRLSLYEPYELYKLSTNLIERFFGSFNDKMHEAGFGMTEISFFLKKIYPAELPAG